MIYSLHKFLFELIILRRKSLKGVSSTYGGKDRFIQSFGAET